MKMPAGFLVEIGKLTLKFIWDLKELKMFKTILKRDQVGKLTVPDFETDYKATIIKIMRCGYKNNHINQWK